MSGFCRGDFGYSDSQARFSNATLAALAMEGRACESATKFCDECFQVHRCLHLGPWVGCVYHGAGAGGDGRHRGAQIRQLTQWSACGRTLAGGFGGAEHFAVDSSFRHRHGNGSGAESLPWQPFHSDSRAGYRSGSAWLRRLRPRLTPLSGRRRRADQSDDAQSPARGGVD